MSAAYVSPGLRVRICTLHGATAPRPLPDESGFTEGKDYPVLGIIEHSSDAEMWLIVPNDLNMIYRISNRHCRYVPLGVPNIHPDLRAQMEEQGT